LQALKQVGVAAVALAALVGAAGSASASLVINSSVGGAPTGVTYANFDNLALGSAGGMSGGIGVSFTSGDGRAVQGAASGLYAAPFLSGSNGSAFGNPSNGADTTTFLSTGIGSITLSLPGHANYLGLLWGSVDAYNTLELFNGATLVGTVTGSDVTNSANGDQGAAGTFYVNINSDLVFDKVELLSSQYAFEADNVAYNSAAVPEPGTLALFGAGLAGFGLLQWRKREQVPV
jgi:hypothetical protein